MTSEVFNPGRRSIMIATAAAAVAAGIRFDPARAQAPAGAPAPKRGGSMTIALQVEPPTLVSVTNVNTFAIAVSAKVTEGLLWYDNDMQPHPQLAVSWDVAPDGLTYTFKLREGVKWHDGKPFTAADVAYSIGLMKQSHPRGRAVFAHVQSIETPDPLTVVLHLDTPVPYLIRGFAAGEAPIVPKHVYEGTDPVTNPNNSAPVGTGPFRFKEWVRGSHILYVRNDDYWDAPRPYLDQLIVKFILDPAGRSAALESGEADVGYRTPVALSDVARLMKEGKLGFETDGYAYSNNVASIDFNLENPYFSKPEVRQAVAHAIDIQAVCKTIYYGTYTPCSAPIAPFQKEYHSPDPSPYAYDRAKAEALLDAAGYPRGADRMRFKVRFDAASTIEEARRLAEFVRASLARIGIAVEIRTPDVGTYIKRMYTDRDFDFACNTYSNLYDPSVGVQRLYWSKNILKGVPYSNGTYYRNDKVDRLLEAAAVENDPARRKEMFLEFQKIVMADLPNINIGVPRWYTIHTRRALGHSVTADGLEGNLAHAYVTG